MKKIIAVFVAFMTVVSLVSCKKNEGNKYNSRTDSGEADTEWIINTEFGDVTLPDKARNALDKASADFDGTGYMPVAYLGSQIVSGINYLFLCTSSSEGKSTTLCTVTVYCGFNGDATVTDINEISIEPEKGSRTVFDSADAKTGKYNVSDAVGAGLSGDVAAAFAEVSDELGGLSYTPITLLGSSNSSGRNYAILCKAESISAERKFALAVIYLNVKPDGSKAVTSIRGFEMN